MSRVPRGPAAVLVAMGVIAASLAFLGPEANADPDVRDPAPAAGVSTPRLPARATASPFDDRALGRVVDLVRSGAKVPRDLTVVRGDMIRVELVGRPGAPLRRAVRAVGGRLVSSYWGQALADVRVGRLLRLQARPEIALLRLPLPVGDPVDLPPADLVGSSSMLRVGAKGIDAVNQTGASAWHAAGINGAGVKVGIIDGFNGAKWQAAAASGDVPAAPDGVFCRFNGADCTASFWSGGEHGVAVAEIIKDMAPNASLYVASVRSLTDYGEVLAWFKSQGVRIISRSSVSPYDGPGNGTGALDSMIDSAVSQGMAWFNAAGNSAGSSTTEGAYLRTGWNDVNADGFMDFSNGTPYLNFVCNPEGFLFLGLRWSDWAGVATNYDVFFYDVPGAAPYAAFTLPQSAGQPPIEGAGATPTGCGTNDVDYLAIRLTSTGNGTAGDILELMFNRSTTYPWNNPWSADSPIADSANPGMATIGAVDPVGGGLIATYSSQGPTNDGRIKPDLSAAAGMSSVTYGTFSGTSAATPVVAGAAALLLQANPAFTPAQLVATLKSSVTDRGAAGVDTIFGTGELALPAPPAGGTPPPPPPPPAPQVAVTSAFVAPVVKTLKNKFPVQVRWTTTGTQAQASVWRSLNGGAYTQGAIVGTEHKVRSKMILGKTNQFAVRAFDPEGTASDWRYTRPYKPRVIDDRDRKVKYAGGWRHFREPGAWKGTLSSSQGARGSARMRFKGSAVSLVVFRSANSGKVRIYIDGKPKVKLNLRSNKVQARRVVLNYAFTTRGKHMIELEPLTAGQKGIVFLDAFLVLG